MMDLLVNPIANGVAWGMTFCYSIFMIMLYFTIRELGSAVANKE
jgi:hypothetical protein